MRALRTPNGVEAAPQRRRMERPLQDIQESIGPPTATLQEQYMRREQPPIQRKDSSPRLLAAPVNYGVQNRMHAMMQQIAPQYVNPFHSPYVDPVGSIVGLRVLYVDGQLCYVPVEPHVNFMINEQFGRPGYPLPVERMPYEARENARSDQEYEEVPQHMPQQAQHHENRRWSQPNNYPTEQESHRHRSHPSNVASSSGVSSGASSEMEDPPWARPHPQPMNGKRGTAAWKAQQQSAMHSSPFAMDHAVARPQQPQPKPSQANQQQQQQPMSYSPQTSAQRSPHRYTNDTQRYQAPTPQQKEADEEFNPWGKGGGGAPLRDSMGNVIADRRRMGASRSLDTNDPGNMNKRYNSGGTDSFRSGQTLSTSMPSLEKALTPMEQHRLELARQIEDNKRRKEEERQKEIEMEKREIQRWEERNARIRAEEEEQKRKERERAIAMEKKRAAAAQKEADLRAAMRRASPPPPEPVRRKENEDEYANGSRPLEWWEKKPSWETNGIEREPSAIIPALRGGAPSNDRSTPTPSRMQNQAAYDNGRFSQQSYRAADSVREHSASGRRSTEGMQRRQSLTRMTPTPQQQPPPQPRYKPAEAFSIMG